MRYTTKLKPGGHFTTTIQLFWESNSQLIAPNMLYAFNCAM